MVVATRERSQPRKRALVLVSGLGGGLWASKGGGSDRKEVEGGGGDQRQPRKRALVLVSGLGSW